MSLERQDSSLRLASPAGILPHLEREVHILLVAEQVLAEAAVDIEEADQAPKEEGRKRSKGDLLFAAGSRAGAGRRFRHPGSRNATTYLRSIIYKTIIYKTMA